MRLLARVLAAVLMTTVLFHAGPVAAATKPSVPRSVKATPLNKAVKVTWAAPASNGGSRINAYAVQRRNTTTAPWVTVKYTTASARAWTETGLVNGARFYYRVMARNGSGWGPTSPQVSAVPRTVPSSPRALEADVHPGALGLYWQAPSSNGGAVVDSYRVEWSTDGSTWTGATTSTLPTQASPFLVPLNLGTRYWLQVRAHNAAGNGATTGAGPYRVYTTPGVVTGLDATVSSGQVELTWTAPASNPFAGIPAAATYLVEVSDDGGATWSTDSNAAQSPWVVNDLTNGIDYRFRVSALSGFSRLGPGLPTEIAPGAPVGPPPSPRDVALAWDAVASDHRLSWQPPISDGGKPLTRYVVEYWSPATPPPFPTFTFDGDTTSALVADFALDHQFRLRACNGPAEADCSPWTTPVGPITGPVTALGATQSMAGATRTVVVDWDQPVNELATSYDVLRKAGDGDYVSLATGVTATQYADTTTLSATDYTYKVVPHGAGTGAPRSTSITTGADQVLTLPAGPTPLTEGGTSATVAVSLGVVSTSDVVVTVTSDSPAVTVESPVTIPAGSTSVDAEISAVQDGNAVGEHVVLTATALGGLLQATTTVDVTDNDVPAIVVSTSDVVIPLGTTDSSVLVSLDRMPAGTVTITATPDPSPARASVPAEPLVFGPGNWNVPQALAITGEAKGGTTVTLSSPGLPDRVINISVTNAP